jgi:hypothetical protein
MRHVNAGVTCQSCHGQVQKMTQVFQYSSLNMGWCVNCHVNGYDPVKGEVASGYTKNAAGGFTLATSAHAKTTAASEAPKGFFAKLVSAIVPEARAQAQAESAAPTPAPDGSGLKKARYDCAVCHY